MVRPVSFKGEEIKRLWSHLWFGISQPLINPLVLQGSLCMHFWSTQSGAGFLVKEGCWGGASLKSHFLICMPRQVRRESGTLILCSMWAIMRFVPASGETMGQSDVQSTKDNQERFLYRETPAVNSTGLVPMLSGPWYFSPGLHSSHSLFSMDLHHSSQLPESHCPNWKSYISLRVCLLCSGDSIVWTLMVTGNVLSCAEVSHSLRLTSNLPHYLILSQ